MKKSSFYKLACIFILPFITGTTFAWNHSIEIGYGQSHDPNHTRYTNSAFQLSSDLFPLRRTAMTFWSITGTLGQWHTTTPVNQNVTTAAISLALRFYPFILGNSKPYLLGSAGPAYLSKNKLGLNTQASHGSIQTNLGLGAEFNKFDINLRLAHYSNAGLGHINQGFNVLYLLSVGYLF